jgi:translation elongation factor EF-1alpha
MTEKSPVKNFALFGAAHAGKSTLAGYCTLKTGGMHGSWKAFLNDRHIQLGTRFDPSQKFAYIVDRGLDEQIRQHDDIGQSRRLHPTSADVSIDGKHATINLIDTPGAEHAERERYAGMFMGDVGIFVVEISRLLDVEARINHHFLAPLITWIEFKPGSLFLIVLSKFDQCAFARDAYCAATLRLKQILERLFGGDLRFDMIPTSISLEAETDENVITRPIRMSWYSGPTFADWLSDSVRKISVPGYVGFGKLACVNGEYQRKAREVGVPLLLRGKILKGSFSVGEIVKVSPVKHSNGTHGTATARVRSLRPEGGVNSMTLLTGELCGFALTSIRGGPDPRLCKSTCLFGEADQIAVGRAIVMKLRGGFREPLINEQFTLIWFGKLIECYLVGRADSAKEGYVFEVSGSPVALASPFGASAHETFFLRRRLQKGAFEFIPASIERLGEVLSITVAMPCALERTSARLAKRRYAVTRRGDNNLEIRCKESAINAIRHISAALSREPGIADFWLESKQGHRYLANMDPHVDSS